MIAGFMRCADAIEHADKATDWQTDGRTDEVIYKKRKKLSAYLSVRAITSIYGDVSLYVQNLLTSSWQGLGQRLDENFWQCPESGDSALEIKNCTDAANFLSVSHSLPHIFDQV